ncbi:histidine phosphatase superfamily [Diplogelasinospora grovesii]|uniref:Histidine phosphatase superfamily n=1 Tax=Diplogelasinospora grovesii TaxID=303347 RepID=A0AAN6S3X1_9PEZI|nr:histidine phosphatase superfamily [Diplogelasinospora grovesii]
MPTYIHLVRHAQGFHNLTTINHQIRDPELTPLGKQQCATLCKGFPHHDKITHLVSSPMRRTLYTCLLSFAPAAKRPGMKVIALPEVQEVSCLPCDTGFSPRRLVAEFETDSAHLGAVDFSRVDDRWNDKTEKSPWAPDMTKLETRARNARVWLRELGRTYEQETGRDAHIVVVTHGGILHFITQDWDGVMPERGTGWDNTEYRSYRFADPEGKDEEAKLQETDVSWRRRRGSAKGLTDTEMMELKAAVQGKMKKDIEEVLAAQEKEEQRDGV